MSRFNTSRVVASPPPQPPQVRDALPVSAVSQSVPVEAENAAILLPEPTVSETGFLQAIGFGMLCVFVLSGYANEFAMRYFHIKAYISTTLWVLLPLLLVLSGNLLRGLRDISGRLWLLFLAWVVLAVPFSVWKGGSVAMLLSYVPHGWIQLFYYAGFMVSFRQVRGFMPFLIASNCLLLLDCILFGSMAGGRFEIPESVFFSNANDLALQLLIAVTQFMYLMYQREIWKQVVGAAGMLGSLIFMFKTGSRGAFLATVVLGIVTLVFGKNRSRLALIGVPVALIALLIVPSAVFHRLTLIELQSSVAATGDYQDDSAIASQMQRILLFRQSVRLALTHPLFGVGPGQFAVAASGDSAKQGKRPTWLGTHNSYTEVASECGIPALVLYVSVIAITLISNFRIFRRSAGIPRYRDLSALAFCFFCSTLAYAICTFFFHVAYSSYLPALAGMSVALRLCTNPVLWRRSPRWM